MPIPSSRPTGRRRITDSQLGVRQKLTGQLNAVPFGRVRAAATAVAPALGLSRGAADLLSVLFRYTRPCDWEAGRLRVVFPSNDELAWETKLGVRTIQRLLRELLDAGMVTAIDGGTGARRGVRGNDGYIRGVSSAIDLSPLGERIDELERLAAEYRAIKEEVKQLRIEITQERNQVLRLTDRGMDQADDALEWEAVAERARGIAASRKGVQEPAMLVSLVGQLRALRVTTEARLVGFLSVEKSSQNDKSDTPYTATNHLNIAKAIAPGRLRPANSSGSGVGLTSSTKATDAAAIRSALRGFPATPQLLLKMAPDFRDWAFSATPSWADLTDVADAVRSHLGISQHAWGQACIVLGRVEATCAIAAISAKHTAGLVRSPGGLLRHMVDAHQKDELRLDRTLFGLADTVGGLGKRDISKTAAKRPGNRSVPITHPERTSKP